jgi:beta-aspartyl-peptidase (threonine type)
MNKISIVIHGGAGTILKSDMTSEKEHRYRTSLEESLKAGWEILINGGSAVDAVTEAVRVMEDIELFNAGKGSVYTNEEKHEMDASIMNGADLNAGCVSMIYNVRNPVLLARDVMEKSEYVFLSGYGAEEFAKLNNIKFEADEYFHNELRLEQLRKAKEKKRIQLDHSDDKHGTVGACAVDSKGNLAAATSTGGMTNKPWGRIGDSAVLGAGTYANNKTCAVSCTGHGEYFIRNISAYNLSCLMEYKNITLQEAGNEVIRKLGMLGGDGGLIAIDKNANIIMPFNSKGMYRGYINDEGKMETGIFENTSVFS